MPKGKKLNEEIAMNDDRTVVVKKEIVKDIVPEIPAVSESVIKTKVKRELSEAQQANLQRLIDANKKKWEEKRSEKANEEKKQVEARKADEEAKIASGEYIRVKVKEKRQYKPRVSRLAEGSKIAEEEVSTTPTTSEVDTTETEDTDAEDVHQYKSKKRQVRREVKKTLKTLKQIDEAIEQRPPANPYMAYLQGRWK